MFVCFAFAIRHTIVPIARLNGRSPSLWTSVALGGWAAFLLSDYVLLPVFVPEAPLALRAVSILTPWLWLLGVKAALHILGSRRRSMLEGLVGRTAASFFSNPLDLP
jgi:hypothetical protein